MLDSYDSLTYFGLFWNSPCRTLLWCVARASPCSRWPALALIGCIIMSWGSFILLTPSPDRAAAVAHLLCWRRGWRLVFCLFFLSPVFGKVSVMAMSAFIFNLFVFLFLFIYLIFFLTFCGPLLLFRVETDSPVQGRWRQQVADSDSTTGD
ncbi:uncharacterized protein BJX67DRAFT_54281 [Aspergillus lucknowensis]|uniref:Uncharacterized protein n=1 Tax=Aspergillus lucknowensis TaxID=176173 RepID=A0ABR4LY80_9EURO